MPDTTFPEDKELARPAQPVVIPEPEKPRPMRQIAFLLGLLWMFWTLACVTLTMLEIETVVYMYPGKAFSPLQRRIYYDGYYHRFFELDYFHLLDGKGLENTMMLSLTMCALLAIALGQLKAEGVDHMSSVISSLFLIAFMQLGYWLQLAKREVDIMVLPFSFLFWMTVQHVMHRASVPTFTQMMGVQPKVASWLNYASLAAVVGVHAWLFGLEMDFVAILGLWQGIGLVYMWLA